MSTIFGIYRTDGEFVSKDELLIIANATERFAANGTFLQAAGRIALACQPSHLPKNSPSRSPLASDERGNILVFDGRIDSHLSLRNELGVTEEIPFSTLVLTAFSRWGERCFLRLVGDWALALWSASEQALYLARDHAGTKTLFLEQTGGKVTWSTYVDTFFVPQMSHHLDEGFAARFLSGAPIRDHTPYEGIRAVPPGHYIVVGSKGAAVNAHWSCIVDASIHYARDTDYENHFFELFKTSVARRTEPCDCIVAQLSGGMDSTSIVCMSDHIRHSTGADSRELIDTVSFYDDTEPNWNERPYFSVVEAKRGKSGTHIDTSGPYLSLEPLDTACSKHLFPGADRNSVARDLKVDWLVESRGYQAILSGIGGDELLGGVPTALPELANYIVAGKLGLLLNRGTEWCLATKEALLHMLFETAKFTLGLYTKPLTNAKKTPPWIRPPLRDLCAEAWQTCDIDRVNRLGLSPTAISNVITWWSVLETLLHNASPDARFEYRYPYLDRDLVDFLLRIPAEQLVRPNQRRSLMRRALRDIVPPEILGRRRKAFVIHGPLQFLQGKAEDIKALFADSLAVQNGFVDPISFRSALDVTARGADIQWWQALIRAILFELWLRNNQRDRNSTFMLPTIGAAKLRRA